MHRVAVNCPQCGSTRATVDRIMQNVTRYRCVCCKRPFVNKHEPAIALIAKRSSVSCYVKPHQGKEVAFLKVVSRMCRMVNDPKAAQICFYDHDATIGSDRFERLESRWPLNRAYFIYPHSGRPSVLGDLYPTSKYAVNFVAAQGHVDIMRAYGFSGRCVVTGWHLSPLRAFTPSENPVPRILFAPIHPRMSAVDKQLNDETHRRLVALNRDKKIALTVRYIKSLPDSGITRAYGVEYCEGAQDSSHAHLLDYDLVVAHQTVAYTAVALGVPTLMMGEWVVPHNFHGTGTREKLHYVKSWDKYKDMMMYPLDILATKDELGLIRRAMLTDKDISDWRKRMIGKLFDPSIVERTVDEYVQKTQV